MSISASKQHGLGQYGIARIKKLLTTPYAKDDKIDQRLYSLFRLNK